MAARFMVRGAGAEPQAVAVDGTRVTVGAIAIDVARAEPGMYCVSDGSRTRTVWVAGPADARWVFFEGQVYRLEVAPEGSKRRRAGAGDEGLMAPMPATVVNVLVAPGQPVKAGDVLLMLEAMKMELPVKAPRDGVVKTLKCSKGELVQPGVALIELE